MMLEWIKQQAKNDESPSKTVQRLLGVFSEQNSPTNPAPLDINAVNNLVNSAVNEQRTQLKAELKAELKEEILGECVA